MKEHKNLERSIFWSECVHLALLTLCFSIPIALIFDAVSDLFLVARYPKAFGKEVEAK